MIVLRPMRATEYPAYLDYFIPDYAAEISANYALAGGRVSPGTARNRRGSARRRQYSRPGFMLLIR